MTWEDSMVECAWCGSEYVISQIVKEGSLLTLCQDCLDRHHAQIRLQAAVIEKKTCGSTFLRRRF